MQRLLELIFGIGHDATSPGVERFPDFNPPAWMADHARVINALLILAAVAVVVLIYQREGRRRWVRVGLGALRLSVFLYVIMLINRPVLRVVETHTEPSVLAVLVDDSISMMLQDINPDGTPTTRPGVAVPTTRPAGTTRPTTTPTEGAALVNAEGGDDFTRLRAAIDLLNGDQQALLRKLAQVHQIHVYHFSKDAAEIGAFAGRAPAPGASPDSLPAPDPRLAAAVAGLKPEGNTTQLVPSLLTVLDNLQGQRLAGVVVISDARETPGQSSQAAFDRLKKYGTKIYPVTVGSERSPTNIEVVAVSMQDSAFKDDIFSVKATIRGNGYDAGHPVRVTVRNKSTLLPLLGPDGRPAERTVALPQDRPIEEEFLIKPEKVGPLDVEVVAELQPGELRADDNARNAPIAVLDAKINVLYVDGYPRWEYRYIKNEMMRDKSVDISCLLTSADASFVQEGDPPEPNYGPADPRTGTIFPGPITRFPEKLEELLRYDVVLFGDVDPRQFTDAQLQMISDFVSKKGGGFGMVAGPQHSPISYRNSAIEAVLPVNIANVLPEDPDAQLRDGWRPILTDEGRRGEASTIFRFFTDKEKNDRYFKEDLQPLFWFCQGITAKPGVGLVYAEHPIATDPTGRKAPLLVLGRFGAGRTLFSAIDDSWRWRYYTGESVFDTYWVQQLRYLARSKKLGQRKIRFATDKANYELGERVRVEFKVLDPVLLAQLPPQVKATVTDAKGTPIREETLIRQETPGDVYTASFNASAVGVYHVTLPAVSSDVQAQDAQLSVEVPRLELSHPELDRTILTKLAPPTQIVAIADARAQLPSLIKSAAKTIPVTTSFPLWNKWRALWIFVLLISGEWVLRKVFGMI